MKMESGSIVLERNDLEYVLVAYLQAYLFYNQNKPPEKIIIPKMSTVTLRRSATESVTVPIEFKEELDDLSGQLRTAGDSGPPKTKRSSKRDASESDPQV